MVLMSDFLLGETIRLSALVTNLPEIPNFSLSSAATTPLEPLLKLFIRSAEYSRGRSTSPIVILAAPWIVLKWNEGSPKTFS